MHETMQDTPQRAAHPSSNPTHRGSPVQLRGMTYAQQVQRLTPRDGAVQRKDNPSYDQKRTLVPGQRQGQRADQRTEELSREKSAAMATGIAGVGDDWSRQMQLLGANANAVYSNMRLGFMKFSVAMAEAQSNQQLVLTRAGEQQAQGTAALAALVGIGLAIISGGAGALALTAGSAVVARFPAIAAMVGTTGQDFLLNGLVDGMKQAINASNGLVSLGQIPGGMSASDMQMFHQQGLIAIEGEKTAMDDVIQDLANRASLKGTAKPVAIIEANRAKWANYIAGAMAMGAAADTKLMEKELWKQWFAANVKPRNPGATAWKTGIVSEYLDVHDTIYAHVSTTLGVDERVMKGWAAGK